MRDGVGAAAEQAAATPLLRLTGLSKRFGALQVLDGVDLEIAPGEIHCLLGENGAGKSTLCNLVFGVHRPDAGRMQFDGADYLPQGPAEALARRVAMVHQHFSLVPDLTVVDNLLLGAARGVLDRRACAAQVTALGERFGLVLDPFARIDALSVGERQRVEIVKCLMRTPRLLVLDEPSAVLLPDEIRALLDVCQRVAAEGCGVVLVTHKLAEIRHVAQRATVLSAGRVVARSDHPARDIDALVRAMIRRDLSGSSTPATRSPAPAVHASDGRRREAALMVDGLTVRDADGVTRVDNVTLTVEPGELVALAGVEGNGQSELGAVLAGLATPTEGRFFVDGVALAGLAPRRLTAAGVGVVPEDRHATGCVLPMSVAENLFLGQLARFRRFGLLDRAALTRAARALMERFDVRAAGPEAPFSSLSGGNQQKAVLARELTLEPLRFLLAAHPTRGLDVGAVETVYRHIREACARGVGVLLISSELDELLGVADRVGVMYRGRLMGLVPGGTAARDRVGAWMAGQSA
jgi:simple sugar transport system ATP-binding protein